MLLYVFVVAFYCRMLFLRPANSSDTEGIPDLNFPASIEQADLTDHNAVDAGQNQPLVTLFTNRNHKGVAVPVTMRPVPEHLIGAGLFQNQKSVTVRGKRYFSDERRIQWQASKRKQRELQNDEVRRAIYRKEYHRKKEKVKAMVSFDIIMLRT